MDDPEQALQLYLMRLMNKNRQNMERLDLMEEMYTGPRRSGKGFDKASRRAVS